MVKKEPIFNIPNFITLFRLMLLPLMWNYALNGEKVSLGIFFFISTIGDGIDGFLARFLKRETNFGAKFDSATDKLLFVSLVAWIPFLFWDVFLENLIFAIIVLSAVFLSWLLAVIKFKRNPEYHLISNKLISVLGYIFILHTLVFTYNLIFLYVVGMGAILMAFEEIALTLTRKDINENIKSFFWQK